MFMPAEYLWLEPVLIAAAVVFVVDLIGNMITFSNRFVNALATAIVFTVIFGGIIYLGLGDIQVAISPAETPN